MLRRRHVLRSCRNNRAAQKGMLDICSKDILAWVNLFAWQFNPRKKTRQVDTFVTWDFQDTALLEMLDCIEGDHDLCIEKSREMGASWMLVIVFFWLWAFHGWQKLLFISRNAEAVESDDPDSLLWKFDFLIEHLPDWMKPTLKKKKMYRGNQDNRSVVTGQASTGKAGVGGRATAMGIDEFSQIEEDYEVLHRTSDTTGCRIFNFTHTGLHTAAYEITQRVDMRKLVLHWSSHPEKKRGLYRYDPEKGQVEVLDKSFQYPEDFRFVMDGSPTGGPFPGVRSPWYDEQCKRKGSSRAVAMDLDIDCKGSVSQFFDRLMILTLQTTYCCEPYIEGDLHFDRDTGLRAQFIVQRGGPVKLWLKLIDGKPPVDYYGIGLDIATGTGASPSCISVVSGTTGEKVMQYSNAHILPEKFGVLAAAVARLFKSERNEGAYMAWEVPGPGYTTGKKILECGYSNVYFKKHEFKLFSEHNDEPGWYASTSNKRLLLEDYRAALHSRQLLNRSKEALNDCLAFRYEKNGTVAHAMDNHVKDDPSGARVNHGDLVIADALAWMTAKSFGLTEQKQKKEVEQVPVLSLAWRRQYHERREAESG